MISTNPIKPFPSHAEIVQQIAFALGTYKAVSKRLKANVDPKKSTSVITAVDLQELLSEVITKPLQSNALGTFAIVVTNVVLEYFRDYSELVANVSADGLTRRRVLQSLAVNVLPEFLNE